MKSTKAITASIIFEYDLTEEQKTSCFDFFIHNGFTAYNYSESTYITIPEVLPKYPDRTRYLMKYQKLDFVISVSLEKNYMGALIDGHSDDAVIITKMMNEFAGIFPNMIFSYIDKEGDSPKNFEKDVRAQQLKWLFKYNYFGKAYLEKYGREFFENMPCEKREYVAENIIRIDLCKDLFSPVSAGMQEKVKEYLAKSDIAFRFYDYKKFWID